MLPAEARQAEWPCSRQIERVAWRDGKLSSGKREIPEETAVALVHDASTTAVMMATPHNIEDFAIGFSLTEGIVESVDQINALEIVECDRGLEARIWLAAAASATFTQGRRMLLGPTGCGLCGVESLSRALAPPRRVDEGLRVSPRQILDAIEALTRAQSLGAATRAVHAAGWWTPAEGLEFVREDVGRHNALDKLVGALARSNSPRNAGVAVLTSRVSVEMVQKSAALGAQVLVAVSAPTALSVRTAEEAGMTLIAVARHDGFEVFTGAERVIY